MKCFKACIAALLLVMSSCTIQFNVNTTAVDLSEYTAQGMYITTGEYAAAYEPVGIISSTCTSGYQGHEIIECNIYHNLDALVEDARSRGANAIINLKFVKETTGMSAQGMAVKILKQ